MKMIKRGLKRSKDKVLVKFSKEITSFKSEYKRSRKWIKSDKKIQALNAQGEYYHNFL